MRSTAQSFLATSAEKGCERDPNNSAWKCDQETIICACCHQGKEAQPNPLGWKKRKYFFHTMQNWIMTLVKGCCEDQNYKRIPRGVSQILGGLTHLQLLNTMTQMPVKNSLNHSLLSTELVISQRNCAMLALSLHPLPHSLLLEWAAQLSCTFAQSHYHCIRHIIHGIRCLLRNWCLLQVLVKFVHLTQKFCFWQMLISDTFGERHFCPKKIYHAPGSLHVAKTSSFLISQSCSAKSINHDSGLPLSLI